MVFNSPEILYTSKGTSEEKVQGRDVPPVTKKIIRIITAWAVNRAFERFCLWL